MKNKYKKHKVFNCLLLIVLAIFGTGCEKFVEIPAPISVTSVKDVFGSDVNAVSTLTAVYMQMSEAPLEPSRGVNSASVICGLSADEMALTNPQDGLLTYYFNQLTPVDPTPWSDIYNKIFIVNSALEGIEGSDALQPVTKQHLLGEAKFLRAFFYFYLVNFYGDVPLVLTTDFKVNTQLSRSSVSDVYKQIIEDLKDAQSKLSDDYLAVDVKTSTPDRVRPNKATATALLARTYLYTKDYVNAEIQATSIIDNKAMFDTVSLNDVFLRNSKEVIWQLTATGISSNGNANSQEGMQFVMDSATSTNYAGGPPYVPSNSLLNSFENNDQRKVNWISSGFDRLNAPHTFFFKYKIGFAHVAPTEASTIFRVAEQYLIRAEARAELEKISDAQSDLNVIRRRAGLPDVTANDKASLIDAVVHERRVELFSEWGHRFLDLKRLNLADAVLSVEKGGKWQSTDQLYPVPQTDVDRGPHIKQNPGY